MAEPAPTPPVLATALEANALGLCIIPARTDGSKAPRGQWERRHSARPTVDHLHHWFDGGHPGIGIVCGEISGNLEMLELEGVAVAGGVGRQVTKLAQEAGIGHIIERLRHGYFEVTPSDGIHWLYRVDGEPVPGNTKLARRDATDAELAAKPDDVIKTLIETRGEGGFTIIAPSHGNTHPSGKGWVVKGGGLATIPTLTSDERDQLHAVSRTFDTYTQQRATAKPIAPSKRIKPQAFAGNIGDSWYDAVTEHLAATETWEAILARYGWRYLRDDRHGSALWCRPGKDGGVGAWVKNDRLNVFSSSTPLDSTDKTTLDRLDVIAAYEHSGDRQEAARAIADSTGIMRAWRASRDASTPFGDMPDPAVSAETGELTEFNLPETFWNARPSLQHIRQAAHSRACCADSVLAAVIARVVCVIPPSVKLPAIVGGEASLNAITSIVSASGGGKTTSVNVARRLVPLEHRTDILDGVSPGSGEGLIESWLGMKSEEQADGKVKLVKRQVYKAVFMFLDEGQGLLKLGERSGATIMPLLRSAWAGDLLSTQNASQETNRRLVEHTYRLGMCLGFQLQYAAEIIADDEGGTPQRIVFLSATDPTIPDDPPDWPGPLELSLPADIAGVGTIIEVDATIAKHIWSRVLARNRGEVVGDTLDSHADLVRLKVAAVLAFIDGGRLNVTDADWVLAGDVMRRSNLVRAWAIETANQKRAREQSARNMIAAEREVVVADTVESRALRSGARSIARRAHSVGELRHSEARRAVAGKHRDLASFDDMLAYAGAQGWIEVLADTIKPGGSKPA